jgi:hypothetical protein
MKTKAENDWIEVFNRWIRWTHFPRDRRPRIWEEAAFEQLALVQAAYFLLDVEPGYDVETFLTSKLERLLRRISRSTEPLQTEYQGRVRGRIIWPASFKARYRQDYDPSRYVCREVKRQYDTPENQLLKFLVERIHEIVRSVPEVIRQGFCYFPSSETPSLIEIRLRQMENALSTFRLDARLRDVSLPPRITESHILRAETARIEDYGDVAKVYRRYRQLVLSPEYQRTMMLVADRVLLLPGRVRGPDGEFWIKIAAELTLSNRRKI